MKIVSKFKEYEVLIERDLMFIDEFLQKEESYFVIDKNVYSIYKDLLFSKIDYDKIYLVEAKEKYKNIDTALDICEKLTAMPQKRNINLISFGGGIVQDISGFVANILYRGIHWIFVPTTLLAAADSCIGGKTSLNYKSYKNLLGTFFSPDKIYICSDFFETLSEKDFKSGMGEVVKFNIMTGETGISDVENNLNDLLCRKRETVDRFVKTSLEYKKQFIEVDEFDRGVRLYLNYAHTFGHAFETVSNYEIPHGTAVAIGMLVANRISVSRGIFQESKAKRIESIGKQIIGMRLKHEYFRKNRIIDAVKKDKKQMNKSIRAVLINDEFRMFIANDITIDEIEFAIENVFSILSTNNI